MILNKLNLEILIKDKEVEKEKLISKLEELKIIEKNQGADLEVSINAILFKLDMVERSLYEMKYRYKMSYKKIYKN